MLTLYESIVQFLFTQEKIREGFGTVEDRASFPRAVRYLLRDNEAGGSLVEKKHR